MVGDVTRGVRSLEAEVREVAGVKRETKLRLCWFSIPRSIT